MKPKDRKKIKQKYGGRCAYSGTFLEDDWQIDHCIPRFWVNIGLVEPEDVHNDENTMPVQSIINHYKRGMTLEQFRERLLTLHKRLAALPKNPKVERSIKRKKYLLKVASYFDITEDKPFDGRFYFELF
jgi:5-methylcytosine-specific restriction endonuclease McrA